MPSELRAFTTEDAEYLTHGDRPLLARLFRPSGDGPFPAVVDVHGGAWTSGDRTDCQPRAEMLAARGFFVMAADFRHAADGYPASLADINFAVRWVKARADLFRVDPERVALSGQSSGGHLAMLAAMRPRDARYAALPLPAGLPAVSAAVRCVAMSWPVINPLGRYRHARRLSEAANGPEWARAMPAKHDLYWRSEAHMAEGNPMLALERGESVELPPAVWVQGQPDDIHDYRDPESPIGGTESERFAACYRRAGGSIEVVYVEQTKRSEASLGPIATFLERHLSP
jgi:acetyl esterase/lipase